MLYYLLAMDISMNTDHQTDWVLGQATSYPDQYDPGILQALERQEARDEIGISAHHLPFLGADQWTAYEVSWLQPNGVPCVAIATWDVPCYSPYLIESKSLKLYLNSFNQTLFMDFADVQAALSRDFSLCTGAEVVVTLHSLNDFQQLGLGNLPGQCLDHLDIRISEYSYQPQLLQQELGSVVEEELHTHLLKSNCLITQQPDWASLYIHYQGPQLHQENLLRYIIGFRNHNEFHEQCVERIFIDIMHYAKPKQLTVAARYTRRGGIDINPWRSTHLKHLYIPRTVRQ